MSVILIPTWALHILCGIGIGVVLMFIALVTLIYWINKGIK